MSKNQVCKRKDGSRVYRKSIRVNGKSVSRTFSRKTDADNWYLDKKREKELVQRGLQVPIEPITFYVYAMGWLEKRKAQGKPQSSWRSDEERIRKYLMKDFGNRLLSRISTSEWEILLDQVVTRQKRSPATRNRIRTVAHKMYQDALRLKLVHINPIVDVPRWGESTETYDYFETVDECQNYLERSEVEGSTYLTFATIALNLGLRIGEIVALRYQDVNLEQRIIHVGQTYEHCSKTVQKRTKGKRVRWLGVNDEVFEAVVNQRRQSSFSKTKDIIVCDENGRPMTKERLRAFHNRICRKSGLKQLRLHDLRHTFASHFVMNGGSLVDLQAILGHSSPNLTQRYAHLSPNHLASKANTVSLSWKPKNAKILSLTEQRESECCRGAAI